MGKKLSHTKKEVLLRMVDTMIGKMCHLQEKMYQFGVSPGTRMQSLGREIRVVKEFIENQ